MFNPATRPPMDLEQSLSIRASWLAYVGGCTQEQIAERLGVSRIKVQRLIAAATQAGFVKVHVEGVPAECIALEERLMQTMDLRRCTVVPNMQDGSGAHSGEVPALAAAAASHLERELASGAITSIGIGHGRTLAATVERLPKMQRPDLRFVSLLGSLTRRSAANPFDVIARLAEKTGGECYFMPVPFIADSQADAEVLRMQRGVQHVLSMARECQLSVVGIADLTPETHLVRSGSVTSQEYQRLQDAGAIGEVVGCFVGADGQPVRCDMNARGVGVSLEDLRGREVLAVAGGPEKADAIRAVLRTGLITALIVDEATAALILSPPKH